MSRVVIVEGVRTPFIKAGTLFKDIPAQELGRIVTRELLDKTELDPDLIDEVIFGNVSQPPEAANIARVISIMSGISVRKAAYTVHRNCASGIESVTSAYEKLICNYAEVIISGGTESMSNIPLLYPKEFAEFLSCLNRAKKGIDKVKAMSAFRLSFFKPIIGVMLGLTDPTCGLNMGQTAEVLAREFGISRGAQDEFALSSHKRAIASRDKLKEEIIPVLPPPKYDIVVDKDNGPRDNQTLEALGKLPPYFDRQSGTVTVGNSCPLTDGAVAVLVMKEEKAKELGYEPLGYIRSYAYAGLEPSRMGLGPAYAIPLALKRAGLKLKDIQLLEINEAFAAQVIACEAALSSKDFAYTNFGLDKPIGDINREILNVNGGAIALGHPVGSTGTRLILTLLKEMARENINLGLASLCVGGGQGAAIVLER